MTAGEHRKILAVKLADLGDLLLTEPALRSLRTRYPDARIDVLTTPTAAPLVECFDGSYRVLTFDKHVFDSTRRLANPRRSGRLAHLAMTLRRERYDAVGIFHHLTTPAGALKFRALAGATGATQIAGLDNGRGTFLTAPAPDLGFGVRHEVDYMLDVARNLGGAEIDPSPRVVTPDSASTIERRRLPSRFVALFPNTGPFAPARDWLPESFASVAEQLSREGLQPVILGASDASEAAAVIIDSAPTAIDLTGQTTVPELIEVVGQAAVVLSGDSFPGHLARALDRPLVSIFGPSNHRAWKPYGAVDYQPDRTGRAIVVRHDVPCSPCLYTGYRLGRRNGCPIRTCLSNVTSEEVLSAVKVVMGVRG